MLKASPRTPRLRPRRRYQQERRAELTRETAARTVAAAVKLVKTSRRTAAITLDEVAQAAGVTVRTILRRFGSRDGVLEAAFGELGAEIRSYRAAVAPGDIDAAVRALIDQYEKIGDLNVRALEEEDQLPLLHRALSRGRAAHRQWLTETFGPQLLGLRSADRERTISALYAATDVYLWKLLRRDLDHDRLATEQVLGRLVRGVLTNPHSTRAKG